MVVLTSVSLGGEERRLTDAPEVRPSEGALAVQFSPLVLDTPERVSCRYQLKGLEQQSTQTELREIHYGGLPARNYEFWMRCQGSDSAQTSDPASFRFRVY